MLLARLEGGSEAALRMLPLLLLPPTGPLLELLALLPRALYMHMALGDTAMPGELLLWPGGCGDSWRGPVGLGPRPCSCARSSSQSCSCCKVLSQLDDPAGDRSMTGRVSEMGPRWLAVWCCWLSPLALLASSGFSARTDRRHSGELAALPE